MTSVHNNYSSIQNKLKKIYNDQEANYFLDELDKLLNLDGKEMGLTATLTQEDIALISYANSIEPDSDADEKSLGSLRNFIVRYELDKAFNTLHILPFYPWDTDRGFSVKNYYEVSPSYGDWEDVEKLSHIINLMFDFVANHASIENPLIQKSLIVKHLDENDPRYKEYEYYKDFAISYSEENRPSKEDLRLLARPRPNPVLTKYTVFEEKGQLKAILGDVQSKEILGQGLVWTTFSRPKNSDGSEATKQVDLNFKNPKVLLESIKIILFYIDSGAKLIRLDAIGYIWKKLGASSLHEDECHIILSIIHDILKLFAPEVISIAEVNEPQEKVLGYLGSERDEESDVVYQFSHLPLAVHAVLTGKSEFYKNWVKSLPAFKGKQFITVLGSHDGMGLKPVRSLLPEEEIDILTNILIDKHKALPNKAILPGGKEIVYEICATPWNLVNNPNVNEELELQLSRYLIVVSLGLMLRGISALYINGLLGSENYLPKEGLDENRTINRQIFKQSELFADLDDPTSNHKKVLDSIIKLLKIRKEEKAFAPNGSDVEIINIANPAIIGLGISSIDGEEKILGIFNITEEQQNFELDIQVQEFLNLVSKKTCTVDDIKGLKPYEFLWLKY
jgi:sucrose phosphorylase